MLDFNLVNVESQSQVGKTMEASKNAAINMDIKDYSSLIPLIKQVQNDTNKILKQFQEYMGKRDKKGISLPYNMIKKFEVLKQRLVSTSDLLYIQSQFYRSSVGNRDLEKKHEQQFYKKVLISYDQRRRWMKQYILKNEDKMQLVEEEVKKFPEYETHAFTQFRNEINFERIQHSYEDKLNLLISNSHLANRNAQLRKRIKDALQKKKIANRENQTISQQTFTFNTNSRTSFTYFYLTKQLQRKQWMMQKLKEIKKSNHKLNNSIKSFKNSLQLISKKSTFETLQYNIHIQILLNQRKKRIGENRWSKEIERDKITNTDYLIYLRDIHKKCEQRIKLYGYYFEYSLQNLKFPNKFQSKSLQKIKKKDITSKMYNILKKSYLKEMINYKQQQKQRLTIQKKERQQRRQRLQIQRKLLEKENEAEEIKQEILSDLSNVNTIIKEEEKGSLDEIH